MTDRRELLGGLAAVGAAAASSAATRPHRIEREVLAFYYGWYGTPRTGRWQHWRGPTGAEAPREDPSTHHPSLGQYDSRDPRLLDRHAEIARRAGLTGLIASWWGKDDPTDQSTALLIEAAGRQGLKLSAYVEQEHEGAVHAQEDLRYLVHRYGGHPAWLKVAGRPVIFLYARALTKVTPAEWRDAARALARHGLPEPVLIAGISPVLEAELAAALPYFEGFHEYTLAGLLHGKTPAEMAEWLRPTIPIWRARMPNKIFSLTVSPGFDEGAPRHPAPNLKIARRGTETFETLWQVACEARPDWVLLSTFNEWHEGSEIEPSTEYGDGYIAANRRWADRFLQA